MAIFHLTAKIVSRGKGQSAVAKAAYNARAKLTNATTGISYDYTRKGGAVFEGVFTPKNVPEWARDREQLWSEVERFEKRKDAQLAREVEIALPHELTDEQRRQLVTDYVRENFVRKGMVADVVIHAPCNEGDERNHHAHILLTMREIGPEGFGKKVREWNSAAQLETWRENWAKLANRYLERHGHEARIDHRSLEAQGSDREPTVHVGPTATQFEREGEQTERGDINRDIEKRNHWREQLKARWEEIEKKRAAHLGATLYDRAGLVPMQHDAMRHLKDAHRIQERAQKERQAREEQEKAGMGGQEAEDKRRSFWDEFRALKGDVAGQKREEKKARTEQTDAQRARSERDALRERFESRPVSGRGREDDEGGRERERERE